MQEEKGQKEWEGLRHDGKHREGSEWLGVPMLCGARMARIRKVLRG